MGGRETNDLLDAAKLAVEKLQGNELFTTARTLESAIRAFEKGKNPMWYMFLKLFGSRFSRQEGESIVIGYSYGGHEYITRIISP